MKNVFNHTEARLRLIEELRQKGIKDEAVLAAIKSIPREKFMSPELEDKAYVDRAFPIDEGQTISQPYTVAYQTQLLQLKRRDKVLEIGTGSGYQAAVLAAMGAEVFTIERQKKLYDKNLQFIYLKSFPNIHFYFGDGYEGLPDEAPFDKILITAAAPEFPPKLIQQLKPGGQMVLPFGVAPVQNMIRLTKEEDGNIYEEHFDNFSFVPMLKGRSN